MSPVWELYGLVSAAVGSGATTTDTDFSREVTFSEKREELKPFYFLGLERRKRINLYEELEEVLKPFYPKPKKFCDSQISISYFPFVHADAKVIPKYKQELEIAKVKSRSKRRKNIVKRTVCSVTAEVLKQDIWAWRKYGQKPIKGSPYPRNYYRCSSSKKCGARKHVERSPTDANMYIVSHAGEHCHPPPVHRSSLAGTVRSKGSASAGLSPNTPLLAAMEDKEEEEGGDGDDDGGCGEYDDIVLIPNLINDDVIMAFCDVGGGSTTDDNGGSG